MKAYVDNLEVFGTRTLVIGPTQTGRITLDESEPHLHFEFSFTTDDQQKGRTTKFTTESDTKLKVQFVNYQKTLGAFAVSPIRLGDFKNRDLFFNYFITHLNDKAGHKLELFFYLGEEESK